MNTTDTAENIEWLARVLAGMLDHTDIMTLDTPAVTALDKLFSAVTYSRRQALEARAKQLWRAAAVTDPDWPALRRTRQVRELGQPGAPASWILIQRTDTGQFFVVSTNDTETYVFLAREDGTIQDRAEILSVSGRGQTRAQAVAGVDAHDGELYPRGMCPHRRGATDLDTGAWHCHSCGAYLYDDDDDDDTEGYDDPFAGVPDDTESEGR